MDDASEPVRETQESIDLARRSQTQLIRHSHEFSERFGFHLEHHAALWTLIVCSPMPSSNRGRPGRGA